MKLSTLGLCGVVVLGACARGSADLGSVQVNPGDAGLPDAGAVDAGADAGLDAGGPDAGSADAGTDAGTPDAGTDAGTADAGTDGGTADAGTDGGTAFGGPGPWPMQNVTYGQNDGIQETPVVGMSTDESQNLWVATHSAIYVRRPADAKFTRFDSQAGLHLASNPTTYCDSGYTREPGYEYLPLPDKKCPITGAADPSGISEIVGGKGNEVFVGYNGTHNWNDPNDGTWADGLRHTGMIDRVTLLVSASGALSLQVARMQMVSGVSVAFWHNRDVMRLLYDHFKHPHELYAGTNHGVDRFNPDNFVPRTPPSEGETLYPSDTYAWQADHLHPQVCSCGPCPAGATEGPLLLGDWRGLALSANGNLLVGGRWGAGKITWVKENYTDTNLGWFQRTGTDAQGVQHTPFEFAMGDQYAGGCSAGRPVFCVGREGDVVAISAVTETPDGLQWFASGPYGYQPGTLCADQTAYKNQSNAGDRDLGVASFDPKTGQFTYYTGADVGLNDTNVRDMIALPDGRIVFASHKAGLSVFDPKTRSSFPMNASTGALPDDAVERMELDLMVSPPVLHVSTNSGATSIRVIK
jgi:hypothetical protein